MLFNALQTAATASPGKTFIHEGKNRYSYAQVRDGAVLLASRINKGYPRLYIYMRDGYELILLLFAANLAGIEACVLNRQYSPSEAAANMRRLGDGILATDSESQELVTFKKIEFPIHLKDVVAGGVPVHGHNSKLVILTTGTTGSPKAVLYTWDRLLSQVRTANGEAVFNWLLAYPMNHFAGVQVFMHALVNRASISIPERRDFNNVVDCLCACGVSAVSATPTFWRMFVGRISTKEITEKSLSIKKITLGGEAATDDILFRLRDVFPEASITHVYATTELGSCFSVKDGCAGFPAAYLQRRTGNVELKIIDGELYLRAEKRMLQYLDPGIKLEICDGWIATGDLVELKGERVYFLGRKSEIINVGGIKVFPAKVEVEILKTPGVQSVKVYGRPNPVAGKVVAAEFEIKPGFVPEQVVAAVKSNCREKLSRYERPVFFKIVSSIACANEKIIRRS